MISDKGKCVTAFGHGGNFFGINKAVMGYSGKYYIKYWLINLYSGVSRAKYAEWTWCTKGKIVDRKALQEHIRNNPYSKANSYISEKILKYNKRNKR